MRVDSSPILLAGQAQAKANQAFGDALGGVIEKFYQKKKDKQEREQRERAYREAGLNAEEAKAASGDKELGSLLIDKMNADRNFLLAQQKVLIEKEKEERAADLFDLESDKRQKQKEFSQKLLSEAVGPTVQANIDPAQPKVIVGELGSSDFARFAQDNQLDPNLAYNRFMKLQAQEQATAKENLGKLGDQFASKVGSLSPYYFSESDAANAINEQASNLNINLTKDQLDLAMKKQKIIDPLKINELATKQIKQSKMDEAVDILQAGKDLKAFLEDGSPLSANVAKEKLARMIQPQGILTEDDLRRVGGSKGLRDRIDAAIEEMLTGKADAKTMQYLRDTAEIFERSASDKIKFEQPKVVSFISRSFGITPEDTLRFTTLNKFQEYLPVLPSNQSQNTNTQNQGSSPPPFQPTQLPGGGRFTPIR